MVPCHPFSHLCVKSCFQPLQWQGFPYLPRDMATYSPHCEICPDFPSLNSSLLNFAPLLTALPLWITANNNSATHVLFLASHSFPAPRPAPFDERAWHETMREGFTQMFWIRTRSTPASPHPPTHHPLSSIIPFPPLPQPPQGQSGFIFPLHNSFKTQSRAWRETPSFWKATRELLVMVASGEGRAAGEKGCFLLIPFDAICILHCVYIQLFFKYWWDIHNKIFHLNHL